MMRLVAIMLPYSGRHFGPKRTVLLPFLVPLNYHNVVAHRKVGDTVAP